MIRMTLGGGCEFMLHADAAVAQADVKAGLPEFKVGLIPAWGGCTQLLVRCQRRSGDPADPIDAAKDAFDVLRGARISKTAGEAEDMGLLRRTDRVVPERPMLLPAARDVAKQLHEQGYVPPKPDTLALSGTDGWNALMSGVGNDREAGRTNDAEAVVCETLAEIVTGGADFGEADVRGEAFTLRLEVEAAEKLAKTSYAKNAVAQLLAR